MKVVLFLGAGFSRAWGLPVMREFFQSAKNSSYLDNESKDFLRDLQLRAQQGSNMLQTEHNNLEDILSFCLASENLNAGYPQSEEGDYSKLCYVLYNVYRHLDLELWVKINGRLNELKRLLGFDQLDHISNLNLTLITTNYDIIVEYSLAMLDRSCALPFKWSALKTKEPPHRLLYRANGPLLCKLHGSINWFPNESDETIQIENAVIHHTYTDNENRRHAIKWPMVSFKSYNVILPPIIVPPTLFKMQTANSFWQIMNAAGKALHEAEKLVFIGFSFPESDTYIRYFLAANLSQNTDLRTIEVVDPNAGELCNKLKGERFKFGNYFTERLRPVECKWETSSYSILD